MECTWRGLCLVDDDDFYSEKYFTLNYLTLSIPFIRNIVLRLVWGCDVQISIASRASGLELFGNQKSDLSRYMFSNSFSYFSSPSQRANCVCFFLGFCCLQLKYCEICMKDNVVALLLSSLIFSS
jgi:hypothetical protein